MLDVGQENLRVGGRFDGHSCDHAAKAHRAQDGHDLPVTAGRRFVDALAAERTRIQPCHRSSHTAFVQKNQPFRRDRTDLGDELFTPLEVGFGVAFRGVERLFFKRRPNFCTRYQTRPRLSTTPASL